MPGSRNSKSGSFGMCRLQAVLLVVCIIIPLSCYRPLDPQMDTIIDYIAAVQGEDLGWLYRLRTGTEAPPGVRPGLPRVHPLHLPEPLPSSGDLRFDLFRDKAAEEYRQYAIGREEGRISFTPLGISLIKGLVLGRGVMYEEVDREEIPEGRIAVLLQVSLAYDKINYQQLPDRTIVFFMSSPLGTIYPAIVGQRVRGAVKLLDTVRVRCELAPSEKPTDHGWRLISFSPVPQSETCIVVTGQVGDRSWMRD